MSIYLVDDDEDDVLFFREAINELNVACWVKRFGSGKEIMTFFEDGGKKPSMIVLDINMPFIDGFQVLERINKDKRLCEIPVFILSTTREEDHARKCKDLGCKGFFTKPSKTSDYTTIIEEMITRVHL